MKRTMKQWGDCLYVFSKEQIPGKGEDSQFAALDEHMAVVAAFDGLGGSGARRYDRYGKHTGAYMASRMASGALRDWYYALSRAAAEGRCRIPESVETYIRTGMDLCSSMADQRRGGLMGSMIRDFPTTAAMAFAIGREYGAELWVGWAGDSRVYLLDAMGLAQLTVDDNEEQDAFANLYASSAMTNVISSDGKWTLNWRRYRIDHPCLVFAATDGCFDYRPTPMEFEHMLLEKLMQAKSPAAFEEGLEQAMGFGAGDDYTMAMISMGFGSFGRTQDMLRRRYETLTEDYIRPLDALEASEDSGTIRQGRGRLWSVYRENYYRCLEGGK